jgi:hypothetical protein
MVTSGTSDAQVRPVRALDRSDSQADNAGSIPVTRSHSCRSALFCRSLHDLAARILAGFPQLIVRVQLPSPLHPLNEETAGQRACLA